MLRSLALGLAIAATLGVTLTAARAQPAPVDLQLVLAVDSSSSVSMDEYYLQLEGYAAAFRHPDLMLAIRSGSHQAVAVTLFEWSSADWQRINFGWRVIRNESEAEEFAAELAVAPRLVLGGNTAIGDAIAYALQLFDPPEVEGGRRVIDISGDGASNHGRDVALARDAALAAGVTVNGLAILNEEPELDLYYQTEVVGGRGAFVIAARDYTDFAEAILKKLIREITTIAEVPGPLR